MSAKPESPKSPPPASEKFLQKLVAYIGRDEIRQQIQDGIIDPLLNHVMTKIFPYVILICVLFTLLLLVILLALGIIVFQIRASPAAACAAAN
jgi:hypothetical protein